MPGVNYVDHNGERILLIDFSKRSGNPGIVVTAEQAMQIVRSTGQPRSIRGLLDLSGTPLNRAVRDTMKKMSRNNGPYMKSVAFVGLGVVLSPIFRGLLRATGRSNHRVFNTRGEALDWLAENQIGG
jgi:hypothetical protein